MRLNQKYLSHDTWKGNGRYQITLFDLYGTLKDKSSVMVLIWLVTRPKQDTVKYRGYHVGIEAYPWYWAQITYLHRHSPPECLWPFHLLDECQVLPGDKPFETELITLPHPPLTKPGMYVALTTSGWRTYLLSILNIWREAGCCHEVDLTLWRKDVFLAWHFNILGAVKPTIIVFQSLEAWTCRQTNIKANHSWVFILLSGM